MPTADECKEYFGICGCCSLYPAYIIALYIIAIHTYIHHPELSIEEFSVPAFNKTSNNDQTTGDIYFHLKLKNPNRAAGVYYGDPFSLAFFYYPLEEPYQKYVWVYTEPTSFYQGRHKTKHIRAHLGLPSTVVNGQDDEDPMAVVSFRINLMFKCRYAYVFPKGPHLVEMGADVKVYAKTGDRVSRGSIHLVQSHSEA